VLDPQIVVQVDIQCRSTVPRVMGSPEVGCWEEGQSWSMKHPVSGAEYLYIVWTMTCRVRLDEWQIGE
jgi:hypothetical protein